MGPSAVRVANLNSRISSLGYNVADLGNIEVVQAETAAAGNSQAKYLPEIAAACGRLAATVSESLARGCLPLTLGGDHSIAIGTASGTSTDAVAELTVAVTTQMPASERLLPLPV